MDNTAQHSRKFVVPSGQKKRRRILRWLLVAVLILTGIAAFNREWIRFQFHNLMVEFGSKKARTESLEWFTDTYPEKARPVFFKIILEDPGLRGLGVTGLLQSNQQELMPVYLSVWRDKTVDQDVRDTFLELIADHSGERGFLIFTDPEMVLSDESRYWALAYDYLNSNVSKDLIEFLTSRYYTGNTRNRRAAVTALSYLKDNSKLARFGNIRPLLANALQSPDNDIRFRAMQAFSPVASIRDIPFILTYLNDDSTSVVDASGKLLRHLGCQQPGNGEDLPGFRELALAAAGIQEKGYPQEVTQQLGDKTLDRLWSMIFSDNFSQADTFAFELALRTRRIQDDITTARFVSFWNHFEFSNAGQSSSGDSPRCKGFGVTLSPAAGKVNYGQIVALGASRLIYCTDIELWDRDYKKERERFLISRNLSQNAGLEQAIRIEISKKVLGETAMFSTAFSQILRASHYGQDAKTKVFEIKLGAQINPLHSYREFADIIREAAISAKRLDETIKIVVGTVALGDRRWYGTSGAIEKLLYHSFEDGESFRRFVDGISISSSLSPAALEKELSEFMKSFRLSERGTMLWCTGLSQPIRELRSTTAHLERDFIASARAATGLPVCVSLLAQAGASVIFFDPFKDSPPSQGQTAVMLNGLLYRDCMEKPVYHSARLVLHALRECELPDSRRYDAGPGTSAVIFPGKSGPVYIVWASQPGAVAQLEIQSPYAKVTEVRPDATGNFPHTTFKNDANRLTLPLSETAFIVEGAGHKPQESIPPLPPGDLDILTRLQHMSRPIFTHQQSHGSFDRSGGNDDGFSGTSSYLYRKENGEYVIFDARGPGSLQRLWMGRTKDISRVRMYFDGSKTPGIDMAPEDMFSGKELPFKYPLASWGEGAGGGSLLVMPLWFSKRLVVATVGPPRFFQADYSTFAPSTKTKSTNQYNLKKKSSSLYATTINLLRKPDEIHTGCSPYRINETVELPAGKKVDVASLKGPGQIRCLRIGCADPERMKHVILQIHWDGSVTAGVGSPLADMFGLKYGIWHWQGFPVGYMGGEGYIHYPMPFKQSAKVALTNTGSETAKVSISISFSPLASSEAGDRYFCCHWKNAIADTNEGTKLLSIAGAGHYLGCVLSVYSRGDLSYLDSDLLIYADDKSKPLLHSTGTDDYFGGANFYEGGLFSLPYCGLLTNEDSKTTQYRFHVTNPISFQNYFSFRTQELPPQTRQTVYSGVFFWYTDSPSGRDSR